MKRKSKELRAESETGNKKIPDWKLERYLLGELPGQDMDELRTAERDNPELRDRVNALRASDAAILEKYPPAWMGRKIELAVEPPKIGERADSPRGWKGAFRWAVVPAFACAAALLIIAPNIFNDGTSVAYLSDEDGVRIKGFESRLEVWRQVGESAEKLTPGAAAAQGDLVQLRYLVPEFCYGAIVSIDGRGVLTVHLSGDSGSAAPLTPGKPVALNHSYELDDAPKFETFYLITAPQSFDVDAVMRTALKPNSAVDKKMLDKNQQKVTVFMLKKGGMVEL